MTTIDHIAQVLTDLEAAELQNTRLRAENADLRAALRESWHTFTCPYDHCQRCCDNEQIIVDIREWIVGGCGAFHLTNRLTAAAADRATGGGSAAESFDQESTSEVL